MSGLPPGPITRDPQTRERGEGGGWKQSQIILDRSVVKGALLPSTSVMFSLHWQWNVYPRLYLSPATQCSLLCVSSLGFDRTMGENQQESEVE